MEHLNNTLYFRLMEEGRIQWFETLGVLTSAKHGIGPILAHIACDFIKPAEYPCTVVVTHRVKRMGRSSVEHEIEIADHTDEACVYARGRSVLVWFNYQQGKSEPLPDGIRQALSA